MANDGKLYIIITDKPEVESITTTTTTENKQEIKKTGESKNDLIYSFAVHQFYDFMKSTATEIANWSISNIGNFSGDFVKQASVQKTISLSNKIVGLGMSVVAGAQAAGPIGALVAGTIAVASTIINFGLENKANEFRVQKQNREIAQLRELSGLNPLTNGGRI